MYKRKFLTIIFLVAVTFAFIVPHLTSALVFPDTSTEDSVFIGPSGPIDLPSLPPPLPPPDLPPPPGGPNIISENEGTQTASTKVTSPNIVCNLWNVDQCILKAMFGLFQFVNTQVLSPVLTFFGSVLDGILKLTTFANNTAIRTGWTIMRDIANMFFILIMVLIAIATILRVEPYSAKRLLGIVIFIAILVNFSRVIAFVVIDFSHVFANAFLGAMGQNISGSVVNTTLVSKAAGGPNAGILFNSPVDAEWSIMAGPIIQFVILLIAIVALGIAALLFLVRIIVLWMLIMVAPLAFVGYILPGLKGLTWSKWWSALVTWSFIAPIYLFFVYIAIAISKSGFTNTISNALGSNSDKPVFKGVAGSGPEWISMIVVIGFLIGGLKFAFSLSGTAGVGAVRLGQRGAGMLASGGAWVGRKTAAMGGRWAQKRYREHAEQAERDKKTPSRLATFGAGLAARVSAGAQEDDRLEVEKRKDGLKKRYGDNSLALQTRLLSAVTTGERAAIIARLDEIPGGMKSGDPLIQRRINAAAATAAGRGFRPKSRPDLAAAGIKEEGRQREVISDVMKRIKPKGDVIENLSVESFKGEPHGETVTKEAFRNWSGSHFAKAFEVNPQVFDHLRETLTSEFGNTMEGIAEGLEKTYKNPGSAHWFRSQAGQDMMGFAPKTRSTETSQQRKEAAWGAAKQEVKEKGL